MTSCERPDLGQKLYRSVRGELPEADELEVQTHVRACPPCGASYQELQGLLGTMRWPAADRPEAPASGPSTRPSWLQRIRRLLSTGGATKE